jgi:hypothetical protein
VVFAFLILMTGTKVSGQRIASTFCGYVGVPERGS